MACLEPREAPAAAREGRRFFLNGTGSYTDLPLQLPCGKCQLCLSDRSSQWATRMHHHSSQYPVSSFITLTYSDEHLPKPPTLVPRHLELLWKVLRVRGQEFSYYACGEYGEIRQRPHYHAILFGWWPPDAVRWKETAHGPLFKSAYLSDKWGRGFTSISVVSMATMVYVAKYVLKAKEEFTWVEPETGEVINLLSPFSRMSRRPAIGSAWVAAHGESDAFRHDNVVIAGSKRKIPRFYEKELRKKSEQRFRTLKAVRAANRAKSDPALLSTERIEAQAEIARATRALKKGTL